MVQVYYSKSHSFKIRTKCFQILCSNITSHFQSSLLSKLMCLSMCYLFCLLLFILFGFFLKLDIKRIFPESMVKLRLAIKHDFFSFAILFVIQNAFQQTLDIIFFWLNTVYYALIKISLSNV